MKKLLNKKYLLPVIGLVLGAAAGYIYWKEVGCVSGTCPIYSIWYRSTLYGAVLGFLVFSLISDIWIAIEKRISARNDEIVKND